MRTPPIEAVVIGGSAGSVTALGDILPELPASFVPVLIVVHVLPSSPTLLASVFSPRCAMRVREAEAGEPIERGSIYFAPADYHLLVEPNRRIALSIEPPVHFSRPSLDVMFESAAHAYRAALAGVVLTGASEDGARGLRMIHDFGGATFVQDPGSAEARIMPKSAASAVPLARVLPVSEIAKELRALIPS